MKVITNNPIAIDSPDHLYPWGTKNDNHTNNDFILEIENYFNNKIISFIDIGCAGGQFAVDFHKRGHTSIGIEGSDYSVKNNRANWPEYHNKVLFTCDAAQPYTIIDDNGNQIKFDCVSSWEVIEHIPESQLNQFFTNIRNHMHDDSIFVGSISLVDDIHNGSGEFDKEINLHQSVFSKSKWIDEILPKYFHIHEYTFKHGLRVCHDSNLQILFNLKKK
jgi:2-polyprenyl-3-methyl-5-hydroxy-6-metoxy-1,4-benzoquinol methylase